MTVRVLRALENVTRIRGVRGAVLADRAEGLVVAETSMASVRPDAVAALGANLLQRSASLLARAEFGGPRHVQLQGTDGTLVAIPVGEDLVLVAIGDATVNVGLVRAELQRAGRTVV